MAHPATRTKVKASDASQQNGQCRALRLEHGIVALRSSAQGFMMVLEHNLQPGILAPTPSKLPRMAWRVFMLSLGTPGVPLELWHTPGVISFAEAPESKDFAGLAFVYLAGATLAGVIVAATVFNSATRASMDFWTSRPSLVVFENRLLAESTPAIVKSLPR